MKRLGRIFSIEFRLRVIAFIAGFTMMAFELVAARLLAPTIGNSTYTWTCVIGVIMAALSIGYFLGGRLADKRGNLVDIAFLCQATSLLILITLCANLHFTTFLAENVIDQRVQGLLASLVLFAPTSIAIGMVSPYLVKLASTSLKTIGRTAAGLSTWNAIGSIAGTFITGFVLFALIGSWQTLTAIAFTILLISWLVASKDKWKIRLIISIVLLIAMVNIATLRDTSTSMSIDSASANYQIQTQKFPDSTEKIVYLISSPRGAQSAIYSGDINRILFWYTGEFVNITKSAPSNNSILVLGGGAFTIPRYLADRYPNSRVDVVEIDPELKRIAEDYFYFKQPSNLNIYFEDARAFVNSSAKKYDLVFVDVYNGTAIPWQFTTVEYTRSLSRLLNPDGVVVVNVIASEKGSCKPVLDAINAPYAASFTYHWYAIDKSNQNDRKNMILMYANRDLTIGDYNELSAPEQKPFTDNFAPIELLQSRCGL